MNEAVLRELWERHVDLLALLSLSSIVMVIGSVLLVPWLVIRAPSDVFVREAPRERYGHVTALALLALRNLLGSLLVLAGVLMLVLPGQGVLTMVAGLCLMDVPKKRQLLRGVVTRPAVWKGLLWIRTRAGKAHFERP